MILLLDNFDSFTYNLVDYFEQLGLSCKLFRNDTSLEEIQSFQYQAVVLSPGPQRPAQAGCLMEVVRAYHQRVPILGICLGHQALGEFFGATLVKAQKPMHGKVSQISLAAHPLFDSLGKETQVVRYHSLVLEALPECLEAIALTEQEEVMAMVHKHLPVTGLQFHPEAVLSRSGMKMLANWAKIHQLGG
jgi:anthranilate synthase/aminodeoxychorismate synthase-like glutamine amidotransferase